jgi:hypothetical protein
MQSDGFCVAILNWRPKEGANIHLPIFMLTIIFLKKINHM